MTRFLLSLFFAIMLLNVSAQQPQSKEELQRKTQQLLKEIESVKQDLAESQKNKKQSLGVLRNIEKKMNIRNQVIKNIKGEVYFVERDIIKTYREIDTLKKELATLKTQYSQSVVYAYKNRSNYDFLNFLFSAGSFGDALKRVSYLKTYRSYRAQKAGDIVNTQALLEAKIASLTGKRQEKTAALTLEGKQMQELELEKKEKDKVVAQISSQEKQLRNALANREKERKQIQNAIAAVIKREKDEAIKRERDEAARKKAEAAKNGTPATAANTKPTPEPAKPTKKREASVFENTPEGLIRSQAFEGNKGSLPWPIAKGTITMTVGVNEMPTDKKSIDFVNDGVTFETEIGAPVKAIFDGVVLSTYRVGNTWAVILRHGKYFSTYSNLQGVNVTKGQNVTTGQVLGKAGVNDFGDGETSLRLDSETSLLDPMQWIRRR